MSRPPKSGKWGTHMLCTKSPKRLRYADNLDGWVPEVGGAGSFSTIVDPPFSCLRDFKPFSEGEIDTPEACAPFCSGLVGECEWLCE